MHTFFNLFIELHIWRNLAAAHRFWRRTPAVRPC